MVTSEVAVMGWRISSSNCSSSKCSSMNRLISSSVVLVGPMRQQGWEGGMPFSSGIMGGLTMPIYS